MNADIIGRFALWQADGLQVNFCYCLESRWESCCSLFRERRIRVTNSIANSIEGLQMPSGLMGPVVLREAKSPDVSLGK